MSSQEEVGPRRVEAEVPPSMLLYGRPPAVFLHASSSSLPLPVLPSWTSVSALPDDDHANSEERVAEMIRGVQMSKMVTTINDKHLPILGPSSHALDRLVGSILCHDTNRVGDQFSPTKKRGSPATPPPTHRKKQMTTDACVTPPKQIKKQKCIETSPAVVSHPMNIEQPQDNEPTSPTLIPETRMPSNIAMPPSPARLRSIGGVRSPKRKSKKKPTKSQQPQQKKEKLMSQDALMKLVQQLTEELRLFSTTYEDELLCDNICFSSSLASLVRSLHAKSFLHMVDGEVLAASVPVLHRLVSDAQHIKLLAPGINATHWERVRKGTDAASVLVYLMTCQQLQRRFITEPSVTSVSQLIKLQLTNTVIPGYCPTFEANLTTTNKKKRSTTTTPKKKGKVATKKTTQKKKKDNNNNNKRKKKKGKKNGGDDDEDDDEPEEDTDQSNEEREQEDHKVSAEALYGMVSSLSLLMTRFHVFLLHQGGSSNNGATTQQLSLLNACLLALQNPTPSVLQVAAMGVVTALFTNGSDELRFEVKQGVVEAMAAAQRVRAMNSATGKLGKPPRDYKLTSSQSIQILSALMLAMCQSYPSARQGGGALRSSLSLSLVASDAAPSPHKGSKNKSSINTDTNNMEAEEAEAGLLRNWVGAQYDSCASFAVSFTKSLFARFLSSDDRNEQQLIPELIADLLTALYLPEWPAAELVLQQCAELFAHVIVGKTVVVKKLPARLLAIDALGKITAALQQHAALAKVPSYTVSAPRQAAPNANPLNEDEDSTCLCNYSAADEAAEDEHPVWLDCDECHRWFHMACVGLYGGAEDIPDQWACKPCVAKRSLQNTFLKAIRHRGARYEGVEEDESPALHRIVLRSLLLDYLAHASQDTDDESMLSARQFLLASLLRSDMAALDAARRRAEAEHTTQLEEMEEKKREEEAAKKGNKKQKKKAVKKPTKKERDAVELLEKKRLELLAARFSSSLELDYFLAAWQPRFRARLSLQLAASKNKNHSIVANDNTDLLTAEEAFHLNRQLSQHRGKLFSRVSFYRSVLLASLTHASTPEHEDVSAKEKAKAITALNRMIESDEGILSDRSVQHALRMRLQDSSVSVRESVLSLVGKYLLAPASAEERAQRIAMYAPVVMRCVTDDGLAVRRRAVRILGGLMTTAGDHGGHQFYTECCFLLLSVYAEEEEATSPIRTNIQQTFHSAWFSESDQWVLAHRCLELQPQGDEKEQHAPTFHPLFVALVRRIVDVVAHCAPKNGDLSSTMPATLDALVSLLPMHSLRDNKATKAQRNAHAAQTAAARLIAADVLSVLQEDLHQVLSSDSPDEASWTRCVAVLNTMQVFGKIEDGVLLDPVAQQLPPLLDVVRDKNASVGARALHASAVCAALSLLTLLVPRMERFLLLALEKQIRVLALSRGGLDEMGAAIRCWCVLVNSLPERYPDLQVTLERFYSFLSDAIPANGKDGADKTKTTSPMEQVAIKRYLVAMGLLVRYYDFEKRTTWNRTVVQDAEDMGEEAPAYASAVADLVLCGPRDTAVALHASVTDNYRAMLYVYAHFFSVPYAQRFAVTGLMHMFHRCPPLLAAVFPLLRTSLSPKAPPLLHYAVLRGLASFLVEEDQLVSRRQRQAQQNAFQADEDSLSFTVREGSGEESVSSMLQALTSALFPVLTSSWATETARFQALRVVQLLLSQGHINPMSCVVPCLALATNRAKPTRDLVAKVLTLMHAKYPHELKSRAVEAVLRSWLMVAGKPDVSSTAHGHEPSWRNALLLPHHRLFVTLQEKAPTRTEFLNRLLDVVRVDEESKPEEYKKEVETFAFVALLVASLPFSFDEPLHIVHKIDKLIGVRAGTLLHAMDPLISSSAPNMPLTDAQIAKLRPQCRMGMKLSILLKLKGHLKARYALSKDRCTAWNPRAAAKNMVRCVARIDVPPLAFHTDPWFMSPESDMKPVQKETAAHMTPSKVRAQRLREQKAVEDADRNVPADLRAQYEHFAALLIADTQDTAYSYAAKKRKSRSKPTNTAAKPRRRKRKAVVQFASSSDEDEEEEEEEEEEAMTDSGGEEEEEEEGDEDEDDEVDDDVVDEHKMAAAVPERKSSRRRKSIHRTDMVSDWKDEEESEEE